MGLSVLEFTQGRALRPEGFRGWGNLKNKDVFITIIPHQPESLSTAPSIIPYCAPDIESCLDLCWAFYLKETVTHN